LCLGDRFALYLVFFDPRRNLGGMAHPVALTPDSGYYWFFAPDNVELVVKVLDGRAVNGHYWVFYGGLTDVGFVLEVVDTETGARRTYRKDPGEMASAGHTKALPAAAAGDAVWAEPLRSAGLDREAFAAPAEGAATERGAAATPETFVDSAAGPCSPPDLPVVARPGLCLNGKRFEVEVAWRDFVGNQGAGEGVTLGDDSGYFWFFAPDNIELVVKVLDGRAVNDRFWVFWAGLTSVAYELTVGHTQDATEWQHHKAAHVFESGADTAALKPPSCGCPTVEAPVCGQDGVTYGNDCLAYCVGWVGVAHPGVCGG
jgi:hypothetical protein